MHKIMMTCLIAISLAACNSAPPISSEQTTNGVIVSLIAVVDGCNVWSIYRGGLERNIYMARCPEGAAGVQWSVNQGKAGIVEIETVGAQ